MKSTESLLNAPTETEERIDAAIYARTSSANQKWGRSLEEQVRQCHQRCELKGWHVTHIFRDEAQSGKDTDRPMFQEMMRGAEEGLFDVVVFWKLDRFSRSLMHAVQLEKRLREQEVALHSITEQIDTTMPAGRFNFRNIASAAEFEREMIKQRTQMGMKGLAAESKWPNNHPPLGYGVSDGNQLEVDTEEAQLVKRIFERYLELKSMPELARDLNLSGYTTKQGCEWTARAIRDILSNRLYMGHYAVAGVEEHLEECQIIDSSLFEKVTETRHRFQNGRNKREKMDTDRKSELIDNITNQYVTYLQS